MKLVFKSRGKWFFCRVSAELYINLAPARIGFDDSICPQMDLHLEAEYSAEPQIVPEI